MIASMFSVVLGKRAFLSEYRRQKNTGAFKLYDPRDVASGQEPRAKPVAQQL
jgi:hypothetical protein